MDLKSDKINVCLENNHILKDIDINVEKKEFIGIIGPNGSGKSTFLKCVYRVLKPNRGTILLDGKNIDSYSIKETSKKMAVVSQHNETQFDFTVIDMILFGRSPHKKFLERDNSNDYKIAYESLEQVGMKDYSKRNFSNLSGGEKQRIILARALAQKSDCLILDEPTNHLDIKYQLQLMNIVKKLKVTVLSAIHDLNIAALYCDKIYALKDGKVVAYGTPKEVLTKRTIKYIYDVDCEIIEREDNGSINIIYNASF
ncbi:MAG: ABC transporter ATP-binding protein [Senegalia sp. (in: firmicutes)]|uniref:ABC transporter ATP-binding protein n=1 Tax=Senegalia sp. (in: firmicutes) TaxID=1924098 RepID=UPI003F990E50